MSSIVTFYSYKGGVGRSMALANIAVLLAKRGLRVLAVDWDLEAPGLERYFSYFEIEAGRQGLLRMFIEAQGDRGLDYKAFTSLVHSDTRYPITLLASGREQDEEYSRHLETFNWEQFFRSNGGTFIEGLRGRWRDEFDIVLIDSRTGLSDTGGICTIQLPDVVVAMFTANYQSLYGVRDVMRLAQKARQTLAYDRMPLSVLPLPSRWGNQEFQETQLWLERVTEAVQEFYEDWLPRTVLPRTVVERIKIPQSDYFGFGEKLAVVEQGISNPQGMGFVYDKVAALLASDFRDVRALGGADVVSAELPPAQPVATTVPAVASEKEDYLFDIFISHDRSTTEFVLEFVHALKQALRLWRPGPPPQIYVDVTEIRVSELWQQQISDALLHSKVLLAMVTPRYIKNAMCMMEFQTFSERGRRTGGRVVVPLLIQGDDIPHWISQIQAMDLREFKMGKTAPSKRLSAQLNHQILRLAQEVDGLIKEAPPYDSSWTISSPPTAEGEQPPLTVDPQVSGTSSSASGSKRPTREQLQSIMPDLSPEANTKFLPFLQAAMTEFAIESPPRAAAFLAQMAHESGQFRFMEEIWGPTAPQLRYEPPSPLASSLGNTEVGDGKRFKGRGPIAITGRASYRQFGDLLGVDLISDPARASAPDVAFRVAGLFWSRKKLNELADLAAPDAFREITRRINGGFNGLADRQNFYAVARAVLGVGSTPTTSRAAATVTASGSVEEPVFERGHTAIYSSVYGMAHRGAFARPRRRTNTTRKTKAQRTSAKLPATTIGASKKARKRADAPRLGAATTGRRTGARSSGKKR